MVRRMRRTGVASATACLVLGLAACSASYLNPDGFSQSLRKLDTQGTSVAHAQYTYTKAFAKLNGECSEQNQTLEGVISGAVNTLRNEKVNGTTALGVMQAMAKAVPTGQKQVDCAKVAATVVAQKEQAAK